LGFEPEASREKDGTQQDSLQRVQFQVGQRRLYVGEVALEQYLERSRLRAVRVLGELMAQVDVRAFVETIVKERGISLAATAGNRGIASSGSDQNPAPSVGWRASGCGRHNPWVTRPWQVRSERARRQVPVLPSLLRKTGACRCRRGLGGCRPPDLASAGAFLVFRSAEPALHVGSDRGRRDRFAALLEDRLHPGPPAYLNPGRVNGPTDTQPSPPIATSDQNCSLTQAPA
jgi:hypothetical protein